MYRDENGSQGEGFDNQQPRRSPLKDERGGTKSTQRRQVAAPAGSSPESPIGERIERLRERAREAGGGEMLDWTDEDCPLELQEAFWESVLAWEAAPDTTFRQMLLDGGVPLPAAAELTDAELTETLHTVVRALAEMHIYLAHTDHLSDRELYRKLCDELLDQATKRAPDSESWHCELDVLGECSKEDLVLLRKYYPDDWCYGAWDEDKLGPLPSTVLPAHDRDHWLPKDPYREDA